MNRRAVAVAVAVAVKPSREAARVSAETSQ
jgi:hypothetical protein